MKKVLVKRKWFWWEVVIYSGYGLDATIEYILPQKFFRKSTAKEVARVNRFNE